MQNVARYQEARISFAVNEASDLYSIHHLVMTVTGGDKGIAYGPVGRDLAGHTAVVLRALPGVSLPVSCQSQNGFVVEQKSLEYGMSFNIITGVRLVKRSDFGERILTVDEATEKWTNVLTAGGFFVENTSMVETAIAFYHKRLSNHVRLPFWAVSSTLTVVDAEKAAETMVRGVGRSRGLGFGMLINFAGREAIDGD